MTRSTAGRWAVVAFVVAGLAVTGEAVTTAGAAKSHPPTTLNLKADPTGALKFNKTTLHAKAGKVIVVMKNPGSSGSDHGIAVKGQGLDKDGKIVHPGKTSTVTVTLKSGKYSFYCPVSGHRGAGMKGHIIVK
jgi:uncharacterized cupredoxin-like copper-binding protein